jgi:hypothetical protein
VWGLNAGYLQMKWMEEELHRQSDHLQETSARLCSTSAELWRAHRLIEEQQLHNQELQTKLVLQRTGSCQNVCCKGLDFTRDPLKDVPGGLTMRMSDPIGLLEQICCSLNDQN